MTQSLVPTFNVLTCIMHQQESPSIFTRISTFVLWCAGCLVSVQVQQWTYSSKTRTVRAAARSARDAGVRVREVKPEELTDEMRQKLQYEVSGEQQYRIWGVLRAAVQSMRQDVQHRYCSTEAAVSGVTTAAGQRKDQQPLGQRAIFV